MLLSVLVGAGFQILFAFYLCILATVYELYSAFDKGFFLAILIAIFPFFGIVNGFFSARLYKLFN